MQLKILVDINTSITDDITNTASINSENIVCLNISNFMFSFLLSFTIDLYSLNPLTAKASIAGITSILGNNKFIKTKLNPFVIPKIAIQVDIVYPRQNPL